MNRLQDKDKMPFGPHEGDIMEDVPASYLLFLDQYPEMMEGHPEVSSYIDWARSALVAEVKHGSKLW